jgi:hypothetical protein
MCYFVFNYPLNQAAAQGYCPSIQESSYLANIQTDEEFSWIQSFVQTNSSGDVWVKLNYQLLLLKRLFLISKLKIGGSTSFGYYTKNFYWYYDQTPLSINSSWWSAGN